MQVLRPQLAVVAHGRSRTTLELVGAWRRAGVDAHVLGPLRALARLGSGDMALGRLDVRPELDGFEQGLWELRVLEREGVQVLNHASALVGAHDKLATAARLAEAGLPHPRTALVGPGRTLPPLPLPAVLKPRFGSWGRDVLRCGDEAGLERALATLRSRRWFTSAGAVAQELVPSAGRDLRIVVAAGAVVGAIERMAAPGEWRTNIALGASRRPVEPPREACELAVGAVAAIGADLAAVDVLPASGGGYVVLEVNGGPDVTLQYNRGDNVFDAAARALLAGRGRRVSPAPGGFHAGARSRSGRWRDAEAPRPAGARSARSA